MYATWVEKNVNIDLLVQAVTGFFEKRNFKIVVESKEDEVRRLVAILKHSSRTVTVTVQGSSDKFSVEGVFVSEKMPHETFPSMFGGGGLLLNELRWRESMIELEKEFGVFLEHTVIELTNSAGNLGNAQSA